MLGKLLKYETKATARLFIPLYITILAFAAINRFLLPLYNMGEKSSPLYAMFMGISMFIYGTLMVGLVVMTLFVLIQRFYKSLLGDEGYLMFTLPVQSWKHILGKLSVSMLWTIASSIIAFFSIMILSSKTISTKEFFNTLFAGFSELVHQYGASAYLMSFEGIVITLLYLASAILTIYAAIALGHLFNKHKLLIAFGMYILLKTASQIIMSITAVIFFTQPMFTPNSAFIPSTVLVNGILLGMIAYFGLFTAAYFALTNFILKRKLNLE